MSASSSPRPGPRSRPATDRSRATRSAPRCSARTTGSSRTSAWSPESPARRSPRRPSSSPGSPAWPPGPVRWPWASGSRCRRPERSTSASSRVETEELKRFPEEETDELAALYESRGWRRPVPGSWQRASSRTDPWRSRSWLARSSASIQTSSAVAVEGRGVLVHHVLPRRVRPAGSVLLRLTQASAHHQRRAQCDRPDRAGSRCDDPHRPLAASLSDPSAAVRAWRGGDHLCDRPSCRRCCRLAAPACRACLTAKDALYSSAGSGATDHNHRAVGVCGAMLADRPEQQAGEAAVSA